MRKVILYDSNTGNTKAMAEAIARGAETHGDEVILKNVADPSPDEALSADILYLGCPAMGVEMVGDAQTDFAYSIKFGFAGRKVALFGSCRTGSGIWLRRWASSLRGWGAIIVNYPGTLSVLFPDEAELAECSKLGSDDFSRI